MELTQEEAVVSFLKFKERQKNNPRQNPGRSTVQMFCYCQSKFYQNPFNKVQFKDGYFYCDDWWNDYLWLQALNLLPHIIIQGVNVLSCFIFIQVASLENQPNKNL